MTTTKPKKKFKLSYFTAFVVATIGITQFFTSHKYFTSGDTVTAWIVIAVSLFAFFVSLLYMTFVIYSEEKECGNLKLNLSLFEYFYKLKKARKN